ncbi:MAG: O-antigen ligase family protein [Patescibacteria group bacterium]
MKNFLQKNISNIFTWLFICVLSLGNLQRIQLPNDLAFYLHDILIFVWLIYFSFKNKLKFQINKNIKLFLLWIFLGWILAFISGENLLKPILYFFRLIFYFIFVYSLRDLKNNLNSKLLIFGLLILFFGFLQYTFLPDTRFLAALGWDDHYYRLISTLLDPNFTGIILILTFFFLQASKILDNKYWILVRRALSLTLISGILLTYSRASYLAFLISLSLLTLINIKYKKSFLIFIFYFLFFLISIPILPKHPGEGTRLMRTASVNSRVNSVTQDLSSLKTRNLIFGQGLFSNLKKERASGKYLEIPNHANLSTNSFIQIFTGTGLVGLTLFLIIILKFLKKIYLSKKFYLLSASMAILIHSLFNATLTYPFVVIFFLGFI